MLRLFKFPGASQMSNFSNLRNNVFSKYQNGNFFRYYKIGHFNNTKNRIIKSEQKILCNSIRGLKVVSDKGVSSEIFSNKGVSSEILSNKGVSDQVISDVLGDRVISGTGVSGKVVGNKIISNGVVVGTIVGKKVTNDKVINDKIAGGNEVDCNNSTISIGVFFCAFLLGIFLFPPFFWLVSMVFCISMHIWESLLGRIL